MEKAEEILVSPLKCEGQLYLERAEAILFQRFGEEVKGGNYHGAEDIVRLMKRLSLI